MLRYRIEKHIVDISQRKYSNLDPPGDRPTYDMLQINDPYKGYKDVVYTPIDMPKLKVDKQQVYDLRTSETLLKEYPGTTFGCGHGAGEVLFLCLGHICLLTLTLYQGSTRLTRPGVPLLLQ